MSLCSNECASFCKRQVDARGCAGAHASNIVFLTSLVGRVAELDIAVFARTCSPFGAPPPSTTFRCYSASSSPCAKPRNAITFKPFGVLVVFGTPRPGERCIRLRDQSWQVPRPVPQETGDAGRTRRSPARRQGCCRAGARGGGLSP